MAHSSFAALAVAMTIPSLIPGPGVFATVGTALSSGFRPSLGIIAGLSTAGITILYFAIFGLVQKTAGGLLMATGIKLTTET